MSAYARQSDKLANAIAAIFGAVLLAMPFAIHMLRSA